MIRIGSCAAWFIAAILLLCWQCPLEAQGKKDDLAKQIQQLQKAVKERDQTISKLETQIQKLRLGNIKDDGKITQLQVRVKQLENELKTKKAGAIDKGQLRKDLDAAHQSIKEKDQLIATLQNKAPKATAELAKEVTQLRQTVRDLDAAKKAPLAHAMILKLKKYDDTEVKQIYENAATNLAKIDGVRNILVGTPVESDSGAPARNSYHLGVIIFLDHVDALGKLRDDPLYKQFAERITEKWERPVVFEFQRDQKSPIKPDAN
jgi:septal ring factor EnvC (AmiA/AmiB activator)